MKVTMSRCGAKLAQHALWELAPLGESLFGSLLGRGNLLLVVVQASRRH